MAAGRVLPEPGPADRIALYEALALVLPERKHAERAAFAAFALAKAEAARLEVAAILRPR